MKRSRIAAILIVTAVGGFGIGRVSQEQGSNYLEFEQFRQSIRLSHSLLKSIDPNREVEFLTAHSQNYSNPTYRNLVRTKAMYQYEKDRANAKTPTQVSQVTNATDIELQFVIAAQNEEIIRLLTALNNKK